MFYLTKSVHCDQHMIRLGYLNFTVHILFYCSYELVEGYQLVQLRYTRHKRYKFMTKLSLHDIALLPLHLCTLLPTKSECPHHEGMRVQECEDRWKLGFWVPTTSQYKDIKQVQLQHVVVRCPHHLQIFITPSTFIEQQKAFIALHHGPKILGQKVKTNH